MRTGGTASAAVRIQHTLPVIDFRLISAQATVEVRAARPMRRVNPSHETAKENGLNPDYITYLLERVPNLDLTSQASSIL